MRWSKLRSLVIERLAPPLQARLDIHSAAYGNCRCGHAWLTLDGEVIANFCTRAHSIAQGWETSGSAPNPMYKGQLAEFGALSRQDVYRTLWDFIHALSIEQALASDDMLTQALAVADARVGKRRLATLDSDLLYPLSAYLLMLRTSQGGGLSPSGYAKLRARATDIAA
ncbi:hypothetical protein RZN05_16670 [Sphingomonas sp. HF-S4]|uniref:Uncharacterized protein n=1 Tax=Sphingomonas agrestis TaxID=3080540 RepID=A0ABU3YB61_9SPHN|nr:hypothetical protein [Sphingomonas sp. HF-S4]MDV3458634.1 hypothetical protein [Sphingomonas sp. HF-S4]